MLNTMLILIVPVVLILANYSLKNKLSKHNAIMLKTLVLLFFALGIFRFFMTDTFVNVISGGYSDQVATQFSLTYQAILRWGYNISFAVLPIAVFIKNRLFRNVAVYVCLLFSVLTAFAYNDFMVFFMAEPITNSIVVSQPLRQFLFNLELSLSIFIPLSLIFIEKHWIKIKNRNEVVTFLLSIIFIAFACIPTYLPQSLLGYTGYGIAPFSLLTIVWLLFIVSETVLIYLVFRFKSRETRRAVAIFLALALLVQYNSIFLVEISFKRFPLQLCNLGTYFVLLALLLKKQSFFNFVFIANLLGTLLAIMVPVSNVGILEFATVHYMLEHMQLFVAIVACLALRMFEPPKKEAIKHYFIGFTAYFFVVLISGTIINSFNGQGTVDYFYLFGTTIVNLFPFLMAIKFEIVIGSVVLYPVYQLFIYAIYSVFAVLLYFATKKVYVFAADYLFLRQLRIEMRTEKNKYKNKKIPPIKYID